MTDVVTILNKLPPIVYTYLNSDPTQLICIIRGVSGYYPIHVNVTAEALNSRLDPVPTKKQIECMEAGSIFGWEVPAADPDYV